MRWLFNLNELSILSTPFRPISMESYNNDLFCCCWQFLLLLLLFAVELEPRKNFLTTFTEFGQFLSMLESWLNLKHTERNKTTTKMFLFVRFFSARIKVSVENVGDLISSCLIFLKMELSWFSLEESAAVALASANARIQSPPPIRHVSHQRHFATFSGLIRFLLFFWEKKKSTSKE